MSLSLAAGAADLVLLTVSDDAIESLCQTLARDNAFRPNAIVAHCSGALTSKILSPASQLCNARIASFHPLQTFPSPQATVKKFAGTYCFIEGDDDAVTTLTEFASDLGGIGQKIDAAGKTLYHAAAVMACNYFTTLVDSACELFAHIGIDGKTAVNALSPILQATLDNNVRLGPAEALTGPILRGDVGTVEKHLQDLAKLSPEILELYRVAGLKTVQLASKSSRLAVESSTKLTELLKSREIPS